MLIDHEARQIIILFKKKDSLSRALVGFRGEKRTRISFVVGLESINA